MEPFVFLLGCARSGTTILERVVDAHPRIAIMPELHWITDRFRLQSCEKRLLEKCAPATT